MLDLCFLFAGLSLASCNPNQDEIKIETSSLKQKEKSQEHPLQKLPLKKRNKQLFLIENWQIVVIRKVLV
jgi:hypothetical protein